MASRMRALTLASAKHLLNMGHITPAHHARITTGAPAAAEMAGMEREAKMKKPRARPFGSLKPQQAQAPIPGAMGSAAIPAGTASGYGSDE